MRIFDEWRWFLMAHLERSVKVMNILNLTSEIFNFHEAFPPPHFMTYICAQQKKSYPAKCKNSLLNQRKKKSSFSLQLDYFQEYQRDFSPSPP